MFQFFRVRAASVWIAVLYAVMGALRQNGAMGTLR